MHLNQLSNSQPLIWRPTFLLHCNGSDGSTTFTDSIGGLTATVNGNAQVDTAQSKFGGASAEFDGTGDWLQIADAPALRVGEGDFTVECWVRVSTSVAATGVILNKGFGTGHYPYEFYYNHSTTKLGIAAKYSDLAALNYVTSGTITLGQWYHMAMIKHGALLRAFVDGVVIGTSTYETVKTMYEDAAPVTIGAFDTGGTAFKGWVDEVRIIKGRAMYTQAFTPPTAEFSDHS